ncbi:MarR family winged helix-turn-helix transcriptional regulator [Arthrobacter sp. ISL-5]|uniref:MarR family winged helix-turn-helix transcriptional regulator n=1 Tax=Arthrobacter sp. ISL-5 TaxID=2819111 RepID=UPI001BE99AAF|nr:MarR family transcriptional regulator [Arthrobacter sp. ISL-5]MBT2551910.1 MarR family transcriptional regulator [Arthrobacter sp. ISL-5]
MDSPAAPRSRRTAFLLSQLGALASSRFAERTREIGLTPSDAGVLRLIGRTPGLSQRALADRFGAVPSRVVSLVDSLQARGLVERERSSTDRRTYELRLTAEGAQVMRQLREIAEAHEAELLAPLTGEQSAQLGSLLAQLAAANALDLDLHRETGHEDHAR